MTRVFLVDDHEIVRRGIADLIDAERDLEVVGESGSVERTLGRVEATKPDVVVLDVRLPDGSGVDLCRRIRSALPDTKCLMLTAYDDDEASYAAVLAGASGYVLKEVRANNLIDAVRRVARGENLMPKAVHERVTSRITARTSDPLSELTLREKQILELIATGMTNRQIGDKLELAEKTVKNYVSGLLAKLGMERRTQAAVFGAGLRPNGPR